MFYGPPELALLVLAGKGKESVNTLGGEGVLFAIEDFTRRELHKNPEPLTCTTVGLGCATKSECCCETT